MIIYKLTTKDAEDIHSVLSESFSAPWSVDTVKALLSSETAYCYGVYQDGRLVGYACLEWVLDEGSLTNLAVMPTYRRRGIAEALTQKLLDYAKALSLQFVTLEVRVSNTPASNLYRKTGFEDVGVRKNYYSNPRENALLMTKYI